MPSIDGVFFRSRMPWIFEVRSFRGEKYHLLPVVGLVNLELPWIFVETYGSHDGSMGLVYLPNIYQKKMVRIIYHKN